MGQRERHDQIECGVDRSSLVNRRQEMFEGVLLSVGPEKAFAGFRRGIVELAALDVAEVGRVADAITDVDGG